MDSIITYVVIFLGIVVGIRWAAWKERKARREERQQAMENLPDDEEELSPAQIKQLERWFKE